MILQDNIALLKTVESQLRSARVLSPRVEAETLITHFGRMTRLDLFTGNKKISPLATRAIQKALKIRKKGKAAFVFDGRGAFLWLQFQG